MVWVAENKRYERKQTGSIGGGVQSGADRGDHEDQVAGGVDVKGVEIGGDGNKVYFEKFIGNRKVEVKEGIRKAFKACAVQKSKVKFEDFEKKILEEKAKEYFDDEEKV